MCCFCYHHLLQLAHRAIKFLWVNAYFIWYTAILSEKGTEEGRLQSLISPTFRTSSCVVLFCYCTVACREISTILEKMEHIHTFKTAYLIFLHYYNDVMLTCHYCWWWQRACIYCSASFLQKIFYSRFLALYLYFPSFYLQ